MLGNSPQHWNFNLEFQCYDCYDRHLDFSILALSESCHVPIPRRGSCSPFRKLRPGIFSRDAVWICVSSLWPGGETIWRYCESGRVSIYIYMCMLCYVMLWYGMYVCMYACMYVCMCVVCVYVYVCMCMYVYVCVCTCMYVCMCMCMCMYIYIYVHMYIFVCECMYVYIYIYTYITQIHLHHKGKTAPISSFSAVNIGNPWMWLSRAKSRSKLLDEAELPWASHDVKCEMGVSLNGGPPIPCSFQY